MRASGIEPAQSPMRPKILIVDDEPAARFGISKALEREGYAIAEAPDVSSADALVDSFSPSVVILDIQLANESGLDYLPSLASRPEAPVILVITGQGNERVAAEAIKRGAFDYLPKPFDLDELRLLARNAVGVYALRGENSRLRDAVLHVESLGRIIGSSAEIKTVYQLIERVAETDVSVLIEGESGTGKELVAREIHRLSKRSGEFVPINCSAVPSELVESELFGHEAGAFTGAGKRRIGRFESANNGSIFLDEIGDMRLEVQAKLLRVMEDRHLSRIGSNQSISFNARFVSATNKPLRNAIERGSFRDDLYYRLSTLCITVPPLRERRSDIPILAIQFCNRFAQAYRGRTIEMVSAAFDALLRYDWPGNIRQLKNVIERAVVLCDNEITLENLPDEIRDDSKKTNSLDPILQSGGISEIVALKDAKRTFEAAYIGKCLERTHGNITKAAQVLGLHRQSLQQKIKELGLTKKFLLK